MGIWDSSIRSRKLTRDWLAASSFRGVSLHSVGLATAIFFMLMVTSGPLFGREKDALHYGAGLIVNIPLPEPEVAQVVEDVSQNTIIRGTKEYNKDEFISGAIGATSTPVFPTWTDAGKVFYKVRKQALDPLNFKDVNDVGTLAVRYIVQPQGEKNTVLRIDAMFVEDFRHGIHLSNGSVESAEYQDIQDRLQQVELVKKETEEALRQKAERAAKQKFEVSSDKVRAAAEKPESQGAPSTGQTADLRASAYGEPQTLEQHVAELRRQVERLVKKPGAPLKSAPFHTASTMRSLEPGTEVLILITTPYWYGVETHSGEHGWLRRDELEQAP